MYQEVRYDVDAYCLDVPNGPYTVTLKLCEPCFIPATAPELNQTVVVMGLP